MRISWDRRVSQLASAIPMTLRSLPLRSIFNFLFGPLTPTLRLLILTGTPQQSYSVSGKSLHPAQRAGLRIDVGSRIKILATVGQRAIHTGSRQRIAEFLAPGLRGSIP